MPEPWLITQTGDVQEIENRKLLEGHVILDYSDTVTNFTKTISIPGIGDRLEDDLRFKKKYLTKSGATIKKITASFLKENEIVLVGIHVRRGDHVSYEIEKGLHCLSQVT